jgi:hypothetical protein
MGTLTCLDHLGNVLLFDAFEHCTIGEYKQERSLGQIIIPVRIIKRTQVQVRSACLRNGTTDLSLHQQVLCAGNVCILPKPDESEAACKALQVDNEDKVLQILLEDEISAMKI